MFGNKIPNHLKQAKEFDKFAGNRKWMDSNKLEHDQLRDYDTFIDKGVFSKSKIHKVLSKYQYLQYSQSSMMEGSRHK